MRKRILTLVLALTLSAVGLVGQTFPSQAADEYDWVVTYDGSDKMSTTKNDKIQATAIQEKLAGVLPGDTVKLNIGYKNINKDDADFYLSTDITKYLEQKEGTSGGGYTYKITYKTPSNSSRVDVYSNDLIGGDETGLAQIDTGSNTFFKIGTLKNGQTGDILLEITLDGNTQGNAYMGALAALDVKFGAQKKIINYITNHGENKNVVYVVPGGAEVIQVPDSSIAITDPDTPLAGGNPQTGDSLIPIIICTTGLLLGIMFILAYFIMSKRQREEAFYEVE